MKRMLSIFLCVSLMLSLFSGCDPEDTAYTPTGEGLDDGSTVATTQPHQDDEDAVTEVSLVYDPADSLNPYLATGYTNRALFSLIYQGLFTVDRNYEVHPMLCKSYNVSADRKTYTFYIANAYFSDGTAVTAVDVASSLKAAQESPWYGGRLQHVTSIGNYGDAVVLELDTAMENLPILLDIPVVKATEVSGFQPLGTGPYRMDGGQLRRQAGWWCNAELPVEDDEIQLVAGGTASQVRDAFEFDDVSLVCTDPASRDYVDFHSDYELWDCENGLFLYLVCSSKSEVFSDASVRAALTHAIDRDALVSEFYRGFAYSATLPASPQSPYYSSTLANDYGYAPEEFLQALLSAGLIHPHEAPEEQPEEGEEETEPTQDTRVKLTILINSADALRVKVAKAIAAQLEEYGLAVTVNQASGDDYAYLLAKGNFDLYLGQTRLSANMDLSAFFGTKTALNYGGLSDPATYAICLEALADADNYYTLHEMIMNDGQLCPLLFQTCSVYTQRGVFSDFNPSRDTVFYYDLGTTLTDALMSE